MAEPLSAPGGSVPTATSVSLLTAREWLEQEIPFDFTEFGTASGSQSGRGDSLFFTHWVELPDLVNEYVGQSDNSNRHLFPLNPRMVDMRGASEATASFCFNSVLRSVIEFLGLPIEVGIEGNYPILDSEGPDVGVDERMARLAAPPVFADIVVLDGENPRLVVEMKRPGLFRRTTRDDVPPIHLQEETHSGPPIALMLGAVTQLFGYLKKLNLKYGILSSFDLIYVAHRQVKYGETLFISEGFHRGSKKFVAVIAYMLSMAMNDLSKFEKKDPKPISPTHVPKGLKRQGSKDETEAIQEKSIHGMVTRSRKALQPVPEIPAECLHLAPDHFATGWSGKIVRGNYEGQSIVVKLAPVGSDRAEALMREVSAYHMLREFWGKYVPPLVSYGTAVGGTVMYIATEEFNGYEMGMGPLSQEVVQEMFDALAAVHQCGILHGDIRRSNILVAEGQQACVRFIDFGFACFDTNDEGCKREYAELVSLVNSLSQRC